MVAGLTVNQMPSGSGGSTPSIPIKFYSESEGVLMIITAYGLIVFQLVIWIGVVAAKSRKSAEGYGHDMLGFTYPAMPTRHEVPGKTLPAI